MGPIDDNVKFTEKDADKNADPIWLGGSTLGERCHICAFFNSLDEEYRILLPFVRDGLERIEKVVDTIDHRCSTD